MLRVTFAGIRQRKLRLLLSGLAVVLGVMFVSGSLVLTDTLGRSFDQMFADAYQRTDVIVQSKPNVSSQDLDTEWVGTPIPADTVETVATVPGVANATGAVEADGARVIGADGKVVVSYGPPRLGINWSGEDELIELRQGRGPQTPDEIAIDATLAKTAGVTIGDQVGVLTRQPRQDFTLVGIFGFTGGRDTFNGVQFVAFTDQVAQELMLGDSDSWSTVEVTAADGTTPEQLRDQIAATLGPDYLVQTGAELSAEYSDEMREGLGFFNKILFGFAGVALFVGTFLILNTFSIVIAQRTQELALTRAVGASRRQVITSILVEAMIIGLIAAGLGIAAGVGVGALLASFAADYASLHLAGLAVPATAMFVSLVVGILVTMLAAVLPATRAARIPPVAAMQQAATPDRPLTKLTVIGGSTLATGAVLLTLGLTGTAGDQTLWSILVGVLITFIGVALLTPLLARPAVALLGRLFSWSMPGKLGRRNSGRNPRRTAITAGALMVGVALVTGVGVILDSGEESITGLVRDNVDAELIISGDYAGGRPPAFDRVVLDQAAAVPGVASVVAFYDEIALVDGDRTYLGGVTDLAAARDMLRLTATAGELGNLREDQLVLDSRLAEDRALAVGDRVEVQLSHGEPHSIEVAAVYEWAPLMQGILLPEALAADFGNPQPSIGFVKLTAGTPVAQVQPAVTALLADSPEVSVTDQSAFLEAQTSQLDGLLTMIRILLALAILIAVLGIINTLALSVLERTRELGLLRAVGLGRAATMRMITVEAVVISLFGALLGIGVGIGLGAAVVRALRDEGMTHLAVPWEQLATYLALAGLVGVVAAILPAIRAARTNVLSAIAHE